MTMLFTHQPAAIHTFDHNVCSRAPLQYRAPELTEKRSSAAAATATSKPLHESLDYQATILMPYPKKVSALTVNSFLSGGVSTGIVAPSPASASFAPTAARWGLSSVLEDAQEDDLTGIEAAATTGFASTAATTTDNEDGYFDQAACAELMEIMSSGSSRSSSNTSSPQPVLDASEAGRFDELSFVNRFDDDHDLLLVAPPQSPIIRANNPLPHDTSFSPAQPDPVEIAKHFEAFLARHRSQAKVFDFNLNVD